jgi:hypothetical protein
MEKKILILIKLRSRKLEIQKEMARNKERKMSQRVMTMKMMMTTMKRRSLDQVNRVRKMIRKVKLARIKKLVLRKFRRNDQFK